MPVNKRCQLPWRWLPQISNISGYKRWRQCWTRGGDDGCHRWWETVAAMVDKKSRGRPISSVVTMAVVATAKRRQQRGSLWKQHRQLQHIPLSTWYQKTEMVWIFLEINWPWTLWHVKYLTKLKKFNLESAGENGITFSQLYLWMNFYLRSNPEEWQWITKKIQCLTSNLVSVEQLDCASLSPIQKLCWHKIVNKANNEFSALESKRLVQHYFCKHKFRIKAV